MNDESLKVIDVENENNNAFINQENGLIELPVQKKEVVQTSKQEKQKVIDNFPSWSIEPPLEIKRGMR